MPIALFWISSSSSMSSFSQMNDQADRSATNSARLAVGSEAAANSRLKMMFVAPSAPMTAISFDDQASYKKGLEQFQLAYNAGLEGSVVIDKVRGAKKGFGLNVENG